MGEATHSEINIRKTVLETTTANLFAFSLIKNLLCETKPSRVDFKWTYYVYLRTFCLNLEANICGKIHRIPLNSKVLWFFSTFFHWSRKLEDKTRFELYEMSTVQRISLTTGCWCYWSCLAPRQQGKNLIVWGHDADLFLKKITQRKKTKFEATLKFRLFSVECEWKTQVLDIFHLKVN